MANSRRIHRAWWIFTGDYAPPERTLNLSDRGEFRKFRTRRSRGLDGLFFIGEAWKVYSLLERPGRFILYSPADWSIIFTVCHIRHLILVFTNYHYIKLKIKTIFSTFSSILSEYLFTNRRSFQRGPITVLLSISARGQFCCIGSYTSHLQAPAIWYPRHAIQDRTYTNGF